MTAVTFIFLAVAARDDHRDHFQRQSCLELTEIVVETHDKSFSSWSDGGDLQSQTCKCITSMSGVFQSLKHQQMTQAELAVMTLTTI